MKVSDYIAAFLQSQGVTHVFELSGGMITHMLDSLHNLGGIQIVSVHHEQAAAFAADAYGRIKGVPGIALATSGPGATNLLTGIGSCYFDSSPAVFITGQVNRNELKGDLGIRQLGFQETDIVAMVGPITKAAWRVHDAASVPARLQEAFATALGGRPGPVLLDIPMDVQRLNIDSPLPARIVPAPELPADPELVGQLLADLSRAQRPLILAGGGVRAARARDLFRAFVAQVRVPVVNSLLAVDALPYADPLHVGLIGTYGNRWANMAMGQADLVVVLGSRLDIRQTGADIAGFKGARVIYHVDVDSSEINNRVSGCKALVSDLKPFLQAALAQAPHYPYAERTGWLAEIDQLRQRWPDTAELNDVPGINPNVFIHALSAAAASAGAYVVDVGQHQMWAAQSVELTEPQQFMTSGGMGAMGFSLPAAIGTAMALGSHTPVVVIAGDGSFQVNIQELQTVARNRLPLKIVILNNQCHGMVRQFQQSYFDERYQSTYWGYSAPDLANVAAAYGIASGTVATPDGLTAGLKAMWQDPEAPFVLQVMIDTFANAYPKIAFGLPMTEMEPLAKPVEMEGT